MDSSPEQPRGRKRTRSASPASRQQQQQQQKQQKQQQHYHHQPTAASGTANGDPGRPRSCPARHTLDLETQEGRAGFREYLRRKRALQDARDAALDDYRRGLRGAARRARAAQAEASRAAARARAARSRWRAWGYLWHVALREFFVDEWRIAARFTDRAAADEALVARERARLARAYRAALEALRREYGRVVDPGVMEFLEP